MPKRTLVTRRRPDTRPGKCENCGEATAPTNSPLGRGYKCESCLLEDWESQYKEKSVPFVYTEAEEID